MDNPRYLAPVSTFIEDTQPDNLKRLVSQLGSRKEDAELRLQGEEGSWVRSLPVLADVLKTTNRLDLWVGLEYQPYQAGFSRADAVLLGQKDGKPAVLVVELKQWSKASWDPEIKKAYDFGALYKESRHPYDQAADYAAFIRNYTAGFHTEEANVAGVAFLHNASSTSISQLWTAGEKHSEFTFPGDDAGRAGLADTIRDFFDDESGQATALQLRDALPEQGPEILEAAAEFFSNPDAFPLTEEQHSVVDKIQSVLRKLEDKRTDKHDAIIVVRGAAGSGKTWICIHLLAAEAAGKRQVAFATNSSQLRGSLQKAARKNAKSRALVGMVTSARTYWDGDKHWGTKDLIIVDEAQRIMEYTPRGFFGNSKEVQAELEEYGITQLVELKKTARVLVLMLGTNQQANANDYLTEEIAKETADRLGAAFHSMELTEQHRHAGSKEFETWVENLFTGTPTHWYDTKGFSVTVADSPEQLESITMNKPGESNRLLAGFAWKWQPMPKPKPTSIDDVPYDIVIGDWKKRWNLHEAVDGYPSDVEWPVKEKGAEQIGSVFSSIGFEFDNVGILMGEDLVYGKVSGEFVAQIEHSHYGKLKSAAKRDEENADRIKDQYYVLLTRGMRSVTLYSVDPDTQAFLKSLVN